MKITILAVGTRGDVQPYVALGRGLHAAGHQVCIGATAEFESFVHDHGLDYGRLDANFRDLMRDTGLQRGVASHNPWHRWKEVMGLVRSTLERFTNDTWQLCQGADAVIFSTIAVTGFSVAERLAIPCCWAPLTPMTPTREFPSILAPAGLRVQPLNWLTHLIADQIAWQPSRDFINHWRVETLGLKPFPFFGPFGMMLEQRRLPVLYGYSAAVIPKPADWTDRNHVTGYWFLDEPGWQPPAALIDFLGSGPPPVYIGFGSMVNRKADQLTRVLRDALAICRQRAVVATGWDSLNPIDLPDTVIHIDSAPHSWLFPHMVAVVHHGGAGTTGAGLRAGVPSVVIPFAADQPFWGQRVYELGAGPKPIPMQQLTAERLAAAITQAATNEGIRKRAADLGAKIRAEDGVGCAVETFVREVQRAGNAGFG